MSFRLYPTVEVKEESDSLKVKSSFIESINRVSREAKTLKLLLNIT